MEKQKQVQIPEEMFFDCFKVCYTVLNDEIRAYLDEDDLNIIDRLKKALETKLDKMVLHDIYTRSKDTNLTATEREEARQEYLNKKGIHNNFRW